VTGGASGLGAATVRMVVDGGGMAVIADLKEAEGQALATELGRVWLRISCARSASTEKVISQGPFATRRRSIQPNTKA
jgi:NAD(P)-dependent dehydrogenase (short-subunit alcohol dehydrogenase family)